MEKSKSEEAKDKLRYELLPINVLDDVVRVFMFGAKKYSDDGWKKVPVQLYRDALWRHCAEYIKGGRKDDESGQPTIAHIIANALIIGALDAYCETGNSTDDNEPGATEVDGV